LFISAKKTITFVEIIKKRNGLWS